MMNKENNREVYSEDYAKKSYKMDFSKLLYIPIILVLGVIPLIVRLSAVVAPDYIFAIRGQEVMSDVYSQYKSIFLLMTVVSMLIILFLFGNKSYKKTGKEMLAYYILIGAYSGFTILSALFSNYKQVALWGVPDRAEGMWVLLAYVVVMLYSISVIRSGADIKYILVPLGVMTIAMTVLGICQYMNNDPLLTTTWGQKLIVPEKFAELREGLTSSGFKDIMYGTVYNPNYLGSLGAMLVVWFSVIALTFQNRKVQIVCTVLAVCGAILIVGSGSAAGMVGVVVSIVILAIVFSKQIVKHYKVAIGVVVLGVISVVGLNIVSKGTLVTEVKSVWSMAKSMFAPAPADYNYKDGALLQGIYREDKQLVFDIYGNQLYVNGNDTADGLVFKDEIGIPVTYEVVDNLYTTQDERYKALSFRLVPIEEKKDIVYFRVLIEGQTVFLAGAEAEYGATLLNPYTMDVMDLEEAPAIGFKGKERLGSGRAYIWSRSLPLLKQAGLLGFGPDTYQIVFPQRDAVAKRLFLDTATTIVDKPHNQYLQVGINQGWGALVCYILLLGVYMVQSCRLYIWKGRYNRLEGAGVATLGAVTGYATAGFFNDSIVSVAPVFWCLLGVGIAMNYLVQMERNIGRQFR